MDQLDSRYSSTAKWPFAVQLKYGTVNSVYSKHKSHNVRITVFYIFPWSAVSDAEIQKLSCFTCRRYRRLFTQNEFSTDEPTQVVNKSEPFCGECLIRALFKSLFTGGTYSTTICRLLATRKIPRLFKFVEMNTPNQQDKQNLLDTTISAQLHPSLTMLAKKRQNTPHEQRQVGEKKQFTCLSSKTSLTKRRTREVFPTRPSPSNTLNKKQT